MKPFRFSPIQSQKALYETIEYIHLACHGLCKTYLGRLLPVAGNIGVFCHFDDEYEYLTQIRKNLTIETINWNQKYYLLYDPIVIPTMDDVPQTTYTHLYIRKPDAATTQVGDVDFYMERNDYNELKTSVQKGAYGSKVTVFDRPDLDLVKIHDPNVDAVAFVGSYILPKQ